MRAALSCLVLLLVMCAGKQKRIATPVEAAVRPLDVVLLLDQSGSMKDNDPQGNRVVASKSLVKYLAGFWSPTLDHRLGIVNFGDRLPADPTREAIPLVTLDSARSGRGDSLVERLATMDLGNTSFIRGLRKAGQLFAGAKSDQARQRAVVILTDGRPEDGRNLALAAYFDEVSRFFADTLSGCHLYVLGIDQRNQYWPQTEPYWRRIARHAQRLASSDERTLNQAFFQVAALALEGIADTWHPIPSDGFAVELGPYLEAVTFAFSKESPEATVTITRPDSTGLAAQPPRIRREVSGPKTEFWVVSEPEPGRWVCRVQGGTGRVDVGTTRIPVQPRLLYPEATHSQGKPFTIRSSFLRRDGLPLKEQAAYRLTMWADVKQPGQAEPKHYDLTETAQTGIYIAVDSIAPQMPGAYEIRLNMKTEQPVASAVETVQVAATPYVELLSPRDSEVRPWRQPLVISAELRVAGRVVNPQDLFSETPNALIFAKVLDEQKQAVGKGSGHMTYSDKDRRFSADLGRIRRDGAYRVLVSFDETGRDGQRYQYSNAALPLVIYRQEDALDFALNRWYLLVVVLLLVVLVWDWQRIGQRTGWWAWRFGGPRLHGQLEILAEGLEPQSIALSGRWRAMREHGIVLVARRKSVLEPDGTTIARTAIYVATKAGSEELDENSRITTAPGQTLSWTP